MNSMSVLMKKELKTYFILPIAYIFLTVFLAINAWLFFKSFFVQDQATLRQFFNLQPIMFLFFIPALTMRLWSEEKKTGTYEYLLTLPSKEWSYILAKFFAALIFMGIALVLTFTIPLTVSFLGNLDQGVVFTSYLGTFLMAGSYIAIGLFASGLTENQIVGFILGIVFCFIFWAIGENFIIFNIPSFFAGLFKYLGLGAHYSSIQRGVIDSKDIIYYLSVIVFFLYLNKLTLESRKWEE